MKKIAVIGAGTMGNGIAHVFAQSGFQVNLIDISQSALEKALTTITKNLDRLLSKERITSEVKDNTLQNMSIFTSIAEGVRNADLVIEAATENLDLKLKFLSKLMKKLLKMQYWQRILLLFLLLRSHLLLAGLQK